jgi:maltose O-acetyltransferase
MGLIAKLAWRMRRAKWSRRFRAAGRNLSVDPGCTILTPGSISVGDDVFIGEYAHLSGDITIGNKVMIGPRPMINTGMDVFAVKGMSPRFIKPVREGFYAPVVIEDEVWIGAGVAVLGGVTIGYGAVIGAASVVTKDIPPFTVAVGNPCRPIRLIFSDANLKEHLEALGMDGPEASRIIDRRAKALKGGALPIVDKTLEFAGQLLDERDSR